MGKPFNPNKCDLCGESRSEEIVQLKNGQALRSDWVIVPSGLLKVACVTCGLIRSGRSLSALEGDYRSSYETTKLGEHIFFSGGGTTPRSQVLASWLISATGEAVWQRARRILEIGAGSGILMQVMQDAFPAAKFAGLELNIDSAQLGREQGLSISSEELGEHNGVNYDIIYSVAVLEHVPSPTEFLSEIHKRLKLGGILCLIQPTQDVRSYDIFFIDHLHHFGTGHLDHWAKVCGFRSMNSTVGHTLMPNFSMHVWQAAQEPTQIDWQGSPIETKAPEAAAEVISDFRRLDSFLASSRTQGGRVGVFGLAETYWLACAYSDLSQHPIVCGLDDFPESRPLERFSFPIVKPEEAEKYRLTDAILSMNHIYYERATQRLENIGVRAYPLFSLPVA